MILLVGTQTSTAVSRSDVHNVDQGRLAQLPGESMLTAAIADNQNAQLFLEAILIAVPRVTGYVLAAIGIGNWQLATVGNLRGVCNAPPRKLSHREGHCGNDMNSHWELGIELERH